MKDFFSSFLDLKITGKLECSSTTEKAYSKSSSKAFFPSLSHSRSHSRIERAIEYLCCFFLHLLSAQCVYAVYMPNTKNICFPCDITATLLFSPPLARPVSKNFCVYILFNAAAKSKHGGGVSLWCMTFGNLIRKFGAVK